MYGIMVDSVENMTLSKSERHMTEAACLFEPWAWVVFSLLFLFYFACIIPGLGKSQAKRAHACRSC
ncbi:hypothetical protein BCR43DRAFT_484352 [Syncephalastrum racemosum]|uniref:Uncharacterized protein n=1 Tax=Syncephalastrum racemosum TaxID=13706 RepID=A0A1X2HWQ2_SYNRA|nr:hypothetical protein BCR43DRAFT_484352 [Syncephalastrum racemosum]